MKLQNIRGGKHEQKLILALLIAIPFIGQLALLPFVNRIHPFVIGLPFSTSGSYYGLYSHPFAHLSFTGCNIQMEELTNARKLNSFIDYCKYHFHRRGHRFCRWS